MFLWACNEHTEANQDRLTTAQASYDAGNVREAYCSQETCRCGCWELNQRFL